jgi:AraC-like DNA-binding protein
MGTESIDIWMPTGVRGVEILSARMTDRRYALFHERYAIAVSVGAHGVVQYRGRQHDHDHGTLFLIEPGESHATPRASGPLSFDVLFVEPELLSSIVRDRASPIHWRSAIARRPALASDFSRLISALRCEPPELARERVVHFLAEVVDAEGELHAAPKSDRPLVRRAKSLLRDAMEVRVSIDDVARSLGVSPGYMTRTFAAEVGVSPLQFHLRLRVEHARRLITLGAPPGDAAHAVGFFDQSHFHRHFLRLLGVTPGAYARAAGSSGGRPNSSARTPTRARRPITLCPPRGGSGGESGSDRRTRAAARRG